MSERQRRFRQRQRQGIVVAPVPTTPDVVATMLDLNWINDDESRDRQQLGEAIGRLLKSICKNKV